MLSKTLYLLRHSQSVYNKIGVIQGDVDTPLSKEGRDEVKKMAKIFKKFELENVVHSPLERAKETAEIINEQLKLPSAVKEDLKEMDFGEWSAETKVEHWDQYRTDFYEDGKPPPGGESKGGLFKRVANAIHEVCLEVDDDPILIVAHGMVFRVLLGEWFTNSTEKEIRQIKMGNLSLYEVEVKYDVDRILPKKYKYIDIYNL
ncbi:histidine phosphatase family protein [Patescibacteria group bacterium]